MEGHPLDDAISESAARAERARSARSAHLAAEERERQAATQAENTLATLTSEFLRRMQAVGNPCLRDRRRGKYHPQAAGWDLCAGRPRFGHDAYRVVTTDGTWLHYERAWDRDRSAWSGPAPLEEGNPSVEEAIRLLAEALIGYGAVDPTGAGGKPLVLCSELGEVAAVIAQYGNQVYDEAAGAAWTRIGGLPHVPQPTDEILTVHSRGNFLGKWLFRTSARTLAWAAGAEAGRRVWLDEQGRARYEAERPGPLSDSVRMPLTRREAPVEVVVPIGEKLRVTQPAVEPENGVFLGNYLRPGSASAVGTILGA